LETADILAAGRLSSARCQPLWSTRKRSALKSKLTHGLKRRIGLSGAPGLSRCGGEVSSHSSGPHLWLFVVLDGLDDSLIEAAQDLGASRWTVLWEIVWPHSVPGVTSGSIIVFMLALGNYLTPTLMGGKNSLYFTETI